MSSNTQQTETVAVDETLDKREARALTESMQVLSDGGSMFTVIGENGNGEHRVDAKRDRCTCKDMEYNLPTDDGREWCKHRERVAYAVGEKPIPSWVDMDRVDDLLGAQLPNSEPRVAMTDGGVLEGDAVDTDDEPEQTYTYHVEPEFVGGKRYVRCEHCEREVIPADPEKILHREDCPEADR